MRFTTMSRLLVPVLLLALAVPAAAQGIRIEAAGVYATLGGDDFEDAKAGVGFDVAGVLRLRNAWSLAVGLQRTSHDSDIEGVDASTGVMAVYGEPRMTLSAMGRMTPYLFGRVSWVKASTELDDFDDEAEATGWAFGAGLGFMAGLTSNIMLNVSAGYHAISLGDQEINGTTAEGTDTSGNSIVLKAGVSIGFGGMMGLRR